MTRRPLLTLAVALVCGLAVACSSSGKQAESATDATSSAASTAKGFVVPADSPLAQIKEKMTTTEVVAILGPPTSERTGQTGKQWIPYYFGKDAVRTTFKYEGLGRVAFGHAPFSGKMSVIFVEHDPSETGW